MEHFDEIEIETGEFHFVNDVLKVEFPEVTLQLTINLDDSTKTAICHALDFAERCA